MLIERISILSESQVISELDYFDGKPSSKMPEKISSQESQAPVPEGAFSFSSKVVPWQEFHKNVDKNYIKYVLEKAGGNVSEAARLLCLERAYLHRLMKKLGIQRGIVVSD